MPNEQTRAYLYAILTAIVLLLGVYGILNEEESAAWIALGSALISGVLAMLNVNFRKPSE